MSSIEPGDVFVLRDQSRYSYLLISKEMALLGGTIQKVVMLCSNGELLVHRITEKELDDLKLYRISP